MKYLIIWRNEEVDEFDTYSEAIKRLAEYNLAFKGGCSIRIKRGKMVI